MLHSLAPFIRGPASIEASKVNISYDRHTLRDKRPAEFVIHSYYERQL